MNIEEVAKLLRKSYFEAESHIKVEKYRILLDEFLVCVQRACYEVFIIKLASAYLSKKYKLYLPAFLDFRGRIYRVGVLHFHERDLVRSLIVFGNIPKGYLFYFIKVEK